MALKTRNDAFPYETGVDSTKIMNASRLVSRPFRALLSSQIKAIVGANAFAHESGIHQDGFLKNAETYEIMKPESIGLNKSSLVMGKHSGRHAFKEKLKELGFTELGDNAIERCLRTLQGTGRQEKEVYDDDIVALVDDGMRDSGAHQVRWPDREPVAHADRRRRNSRH